MSAVSRFLGTAAAFAVVGAGVAALSRLLKKQQEKLDAARADTELDALEQAAEALDAEELADAAALDGDAVQAQEACRAAEEATPDKTARDFAVPCETPRTEPLAGYTPRPDAGPNANPVLSSSADAPRRADGTIDAEKLCAPEDFGDWDDLGCQG